MPGLGYLNSCMYLLACTTRALCRRALVRRFSTAQPAQPVLARDWISESLYHPDYGYFNTDASPVGQLPEQLPFTRLYGQQEYLQQLRSWYDKLQTSWLTPAEIFHPVYGQAVASAMLQHSSKVSTPVNIIEVGGGSGRLAKDVLDHLQAQAPDQYKDCSYTSLEISPKLAHIQRQKVLADGKHADQYRVLQQDAVDSSSWSTVNPKPCIILLMEVLDNLPHDRVWRNSTEAEWQETWVQTSTNAEEKFPKEVTRPVADNSVWACLDLAQQEQQHLPPQPWLHATMDWLLGQVSPSGHASEQILWLPTTSLQLLQHICKARPNHLIIAADFDELPEVVVPGQGAPLVASTVKAACNSAAFFRSSLVISTIIFIILIIIIIIHMRKAVWRSHVHTEAVKCFQLSASTATLCHCR